MFKFIVLALIPIATASANDFDVEWPESDKEFHVLAITIEGCRTTFKIPTKNFKNFDKNDAALDQAMEIASKRAATGCN